MNDRIKRATELLEQWITETGEDNPLAIEGQLEKFVTQVDEDRLSGRKSSQHQANRGSISLKPRYSGKKSKRFWSCINRLPAKSRGTAYSLGVVLQNVEKDILRLIELERKNEPTEDTR